VSTPRAGMRNQLSRTGSWSVQWDAYAPLPSHPPPLPATPNITLDALKAAMSYLSNTANLSTHHSIWKPHSTTPADTTSQRQPSQTELEATDPSQERQVYTDDVWQAEPRATEKRDCLRKSFLNGTAAMEEKIFTLAGQDGVVTAIFHCIGHRDKCACDRHRCP
jgi:hypothetical protein